MSESHIAPTEEEIKEEQNILKETPESEIRAKVIADYGLDEEVDSEVIDKITKRESENKKVLSKAIRQKISAREALKAGVKPEVKPETKPDIDYDKIVDEKLNKRLTERDIENLEYGDNVKNIVRDLVARGKTVSEALKDPYTQFHMEKEEREGKNEDAGVYRTPRAFSRGREEKDPIQEIARKHAVEVPKGDSVPLPDSHFTELEESLKKVGADVSQHIRINPNQKR